MARIDKLLELLNTLILTFMDNIVTIDKETLLSILTCLQVSQAKVRLLQTHTQLLHDELEWKNLRHSKLVFVHNNPLFEEEDDDDQIQ